MLKPPLLGLVMIVKNEAAGILRTLDSVKEVIDRFDILDTGSTDGTQSLIKDWGFRNFVPGIVSDGVFKDYSQARNLALRGCPARWALMLSGDETALPLSVEFRPFLRDSLHAEHDVTVTLDRLQFLHPRLMRPHAGARYVGRTHEQLLSTNLGQPAPFAIRGGRRGEDRTARLEMDLELLGTATARDTFYRAQTHEGLGNIPAAQALYRMRAQRWDGDENERWEAMIRAGRLVSPMMLYTAARQRPERAEPWYYLAQHYRKVGKVKTALKCLDRADRCRPPTGRGFVHLDAYSTYAERLALAHGVLGHGTILACPSEPSAKIPTK